MSLDTSLASSINAFSASPSRDQLITLTIGQLKGIIKEALQPLQDRVSTLEDKTVSLEEENAALRLKLASLEATQDTHAENQLIQLRLIGQLREATKKEPQPLQRDRGEILRALLAANGGKMLAKDARQKMHLTENRFSELLKVCDFIEVKQLHSDKRKFVIILKSELLPRK